MVKLLLSLMIIVTIVAPVSAIPSAIEKPASKLAQSSDSSAQRNEAGRSEQEFETSVEERQAQREERLRARSARACEFVKARLEAHMERIEFRADQRSRRYQNMLNRLDRIALRIENNNGDASELRAKIVVLGGLVGDFKTEYGAYNAELQQAVTTSCSGSEPLRAVIGQAISNLRSAKVKHSAIREFLGSDIKPYLQALKEQLSDDDSTRPDLEDNQEATENNAPDAQETE